MSVQSRTRSDRHSQQQPGLLPRQRTPGTPVPPASRRSTGDRRLRAAGLAAGVVIGLGAAGTGVWALVDDGSTPTAPAATTVDTSRTEAQRDAALVRRGPEASALSERLRREFQRDAARAGLVVP